MRVRQRVQRDLPAAQPAEDPPRRESRGRVDQHLAQQVDVDRIGGKPLEDEHVVGQLLHRGCPGRVAWMARCSSHRAQPHDNGQPARRSGDIDRWSDVGQNPPRDRSGRGRDVGGIDERETPVRRGGDHRAGDCGPGRGRAGPAESRGSPQHLRARRDRGQPPRRTRLLDAVPRGGRTDLAAGPGLSVLVAAAYAIGGVGDAPGLAAPGAGTMPSWADSSSGASCGWPARSRRAAPSWPATAGLIAALHPTLIYAATHVQVAGLARDRARLDPGLGLPDRGVQARPRDAAITGAVPRLAGAHRPDPRRWRRSGSTWAVWQGRRRGSASRCV